MEHTQFDKKIKESLANLEVSFDATPWEGIEKALDAMETPVVPAAENDFDAFISSKLENLSIPAKQPNWERMSAALDEAGMSDAFDQEVKYKMDIINPVYQPSHWELLADQLRREKAVKESLYKNKIAELTLFILLLLNFYQYFPNYPQIASLPVPTQQASKIAVEEKKILAESAPQKPAAANQGISVVPTTTTQEFPVKEERSVSKEVISIGKKPSPTSDNALYILENQATIDIKGISAQPSREEIQFGIDGKTGLTITVPEMTEHLGRMGLTNSLFVETIPSLVPASLATAKIVPLDCENCKRLKIPALFRFGMMGQVGLTHAAHTTNQDLDFSTVEGSHLGSAYGGGFTLGFKYSRWEIETGLLYAAKRYNHLALHYEYPIQLKGLSLETLQTPVNVRYNYVVSESGKLHLYMQAGIAYNLVLREEQDIIRLSRTEADWLDAPSTLRPNLASRAVARNANKGLFGGDYNSFLTFNMGAGAEYYLSPKWSVFFQSEFQNYISQSRIGPTKDRINTIPLSFGVRSSFY